MTLLKAGSGRGKLFKGAKYWKIDRKDNDDFSKAVTILKEELQNRMISLIIR